MDIAMWLTRRLKRRLRCVRAVTFSCTSVYFWNILQREILKKISRFFVAGAVQSSSDLKTLPRAVANLTSSSEDPCVNWHILPIVQVQNVLVLAFSQLMYMIIQVIILKIHSIVKQYSSIGTTSFSESLSWERGCYWNCILFYRQFDDVKLPEQHCLHIVFEKD